MSQARSSSKSKSRGSGKHKKPPVSPIKPVETASDSDASLNFGAVLLGMVTTLILVFGVFGLGSDAVDRPMTESEKERAESRARAERADTLDQMMIDLTNLKNQPGVTELVERVNLCEQRISLAHRILEKEPTDPLMRQTAVVENMLAHVRLYGLDFKNNLNIADCSSRLKEAFTPYLEDPDRKIYSNAQIARLTFSSFEKIKSGSDELDDLVALFTEIIQRFPDDRYVASMIESHLNVLISSDPRYAQKVFSRIRAENSEGSISDLMESKFRNIADSIVLRQAEFERKYSDRWASGKAGREELVRTSRELLAKPKIGIQVVNRVATFGIWLEKNGWYEDAMLIFDEIASCPRNGNLHNDFHDKADAIGAAGIRRCNLTGKVLFYRGMDGQGKSLDDAALKKHVVIVVYWSESSAESLQYLEQLNKGARTLGNKAVTILAVCLDRKLNRKLAFYKNKAPQIKIVLHTNANEINSLYQSCPPSKLPHVMLVGYGGRVHDVNTEPLDVRNDALNLVTQRNP